MIFCASFFNVCVSEENEIKDENFNFRFMQNFLLIDHHPIICNAVEQLIRSRINSETNVMATVDYKEIITAAKSSKLDLIIMGVFLSEIDVQNLIIQLQRINPKLKILIFSCANEEVFALHYLKQGVCGFVSKLASEDILEKAIRMALSGKKYISPKVADMLVENLNQKEKNAGNPFSTLSCRELEVAKLIGVGMGVSEIAAILGMHIATAGTHKSRIFKKLNVSSVNGFEQLSKLHGFDESSCIE